MRKSDDELYGPTYYQAYYCGSAPPIAYERNDHWLTFFGTVADAIIQRLRPETVFDAGCAMGFLVEALRVRGVDAAGRDVSSHAIAQAHSSITDYVRVGSITEPIDGRYDLITCIEVLEHLEPADLDAALRSLTEATDCLLLSTTPGDFQEPTHVNVQPPEFWAARMAEFGFYRDLSFDGSFLTPWTGLFRRTQRSDVDLVSDYERDRWQLLQERNALRSAAIEVHRANADRAGSTDAQGGGPAGRAGDSEVQGLRDRLRLAIDAAHAADAQRATVEGRLRHVEYALWAAEAREEETGEMIERIYDLAEGDIRRLEALLDARSYRTYWRLLAPYRWLRDRMT